MSAIQVPSYLLDAIGAHGRTEYPREACGFLSGPRGGFPNRFVPVMNKHSHPEGYYAMDSTGVLNAYKVMDDLKEDPLVVYHTHTKSGSELSRMDVVEAWNLDAVYIVCSMERSQSQPAYQAWRIIEEKAEDSPDVVSSQCYLIDEAKDIIRRVEEVALDIIDMGHPDSPIHGLVEGNRIRIIWDSEGGRRTTVATVGPRAENGRSVKIYPLRPGTGGSTLIIGLDRIRAVGILAEGSNQAKMRAQAASFLAEAAMRLASGDPGGARKAIQRAGLILPRIIPEPPAVPRAYRPRRRPEE